MWSEGIALAPELVVLALGGAAAVAANSWSGWFRHHLQPGFAAQCHLARSGADALRARLRA